MITSIEQINQICFPATKHELLQALESTYILCSNNLSEDEKKKFRYDLDFLYNEKGKWLVHSTFAGGIIFLREPETINKINISFFTYLNIANVSVVYASEKRNVRNVKYKPNIGQLESTTWAVEQIFPNFNAHQKDTKLILMAIIGNIVKYICEDYRRSSWFMNYEKPFNIELFLDDVLELNYKVNIE